MNTNGILACNIKRKLGFYGHLCRLKSERKVEGLVVRITWKAQKEREDLADVAMTTWKTRVKETSTEDSARQRSVEGRDQITSG